MYEQHLLVDAAATCKRHLVTTGNIYIYMHGGARYLPIPWSGEGDLVILCMQN